MADSGWLARAKAAALEIFKGAENAEPGGELAKAQGIYNVDHVSVSMLMGSGKRMARSRTDLYLKYHYMSGDPIISTALRSHITAALGGDERTGQTVFLDQVPGTEKDATKTRYAEELREDLLALFNRIAHGTAYNACAFGDAYGRVYAKEGEGIQDVNIDEMVLPPLVQPYERASQTEGFVVSTGDKFTERLTKKQMVRCKMPRMLYVPQMRVIEKALRTNLKVDTLDDLELTPALVGGSFLEAAEEAYDNLMSTLTGLVGQRILNSIDESMIGANLEGMTVEQRKEFMSSLKKMLMASKQRAEAAVKAGKPVTERSYHIIPTFSEKQMTSISQFNGTSGASSISVEDVMFHAKMLAGALGTDLSILGFSDLLSGGLGEGGFFRTSVHSAERARIIRTALDGFFYTLIDLHTYFKYGFVFDPKDRPVTVNYYGSISALENEKQSSRERSVQATSVMLTALEQVKNLGLEEDVNRMILEKGMELDSEFAEIIAKGIAGLPKEEDDGGGSGGGNRLGFSH